MAAEAGEKIQGLYPREFSISYVDFEPVIRITSDLFLLRPLCCGEMNEFK